MKSIYNVYVVVELVTDVMNSLSATQGVIFAKHVDARRVINVT